MELCLLPKSEKITTMESKPIDKKIIAGVLLMLAGGLLLLDTFNLTDLPLKYYIFSWKTLLIGIGIILLTTKERQTPGYVLIGLGILFWLPSFVDYNISLNQIFLPALLMGVGVIILTRRQGHQRRHVWDGKPPMGHNSDYIDDIAILGGGMKQVQSKNFKGGSITAIFGGSEFNMRDAELSPEGCTIDVFNMFGGSKLIVPETWEIKSDVVSIFGGFSDKRLTKPAIAENKNLILVKGVVIFGGLEIKSY
jgi:predicted membrane protein